MYANWAGAPFHPFPTIITERETLSQRRHTNDVVLSSVRVFNSWFRGRRLRSVLALQLQVLLDAAHGRRPAVVAAEPRGRRRAAVDEDGGSVAPAP